MQGNWYDPPILAMFGIVAGFSTVALWGGYKFYSGSYHMWESLLDDPEEPADGAAPALENPRPATVDPFTWLVKKTEWLQDVERWSGRRLRSYDLLIELLSEPERLREIQNDLYRYEIVNNIVKGGFQNAWAGHIERKDATVLKPMAQAILRSPEVIPQMLKVARAGRARAESYAAEGKAVMDWARSLGPWIYQRPEAPMPKIPKPKVKDAKQALTAFQEALSDVLHGIETLPDDKARRSARWRMLDFLQAV